MNIRLWAQLLPPIMLCLCAVTNAAAQDAPPAPRVQAVVDSAVAETRKQFPKLQADQIAVTLVDLHDAENPARGSYRGSEQIYPASVIKLFYLAATHRWIADGKLTSTPELDRALRDMIVHSYNEATHYVVDLLTETTSGPELPEAEIKEWFEKRNAVNRYFASLGYTGVVANKKPWCEGPYGRETQAMKLFETRRNALTTDATARLMTEIVTRKCVSSQRSCLMQDLLRRDPFSKDKDADNQSKFTGSVLPPGAKLWSKAGWTSQTRHDCAYVELPDGRKFVLVTFTVDHASERGIIHAVARKVVEELK
ncbi:MAG: serine hydrolase [Proteobacteria bacterium]|nr:serine hydrolase [Pseudomonadota bacterium]